MGDMRDVVAGGGTREAAAARRLGWLLGSLGQGDGAGGGGGARGKERQSVEESASCRRGSDRLIREEARTGNLI